MMAKKLFLDTNIVADLIDQNRPNHAQSMSLIEKIILDGWDICISEDMISTLFYISKKKKQTLEFLKNVVFVDWQILGFGKNILEEAVALSLQKEVDLEDILQCLCAKNNGCEVILTNDTRFYDCGIALLKPQEFLER